MPQRNIKKGCIFCQEVRESLSEEVLFALRPEYHVRVNHVALGRGISRCKGTEAATGLKRSWPVWLEWLERGGPSVGRAYRAVLVKSQ